jgi:ectoine hydroxylase-related dioxygenase (phytanoyl-CoA dioxygenase family)
MQEIIELAEAVAADGYAVWPSLVDGEQLMALQASASRLLASPHGRSYPKSTRAWDLHLHGSPYVDVLIDTRMTSLLDALLGDGHLLSDFSLNQVHPHQPPDDWHIDYPYNEMPTLVSGSLLGLQCVLALDGFGKDNGATHLLPGTHTTPRRPVAPYGSAVLFEAPPGSLLIMAAATWHRSGLNTCGRSRTAMLMSFVERWIKPMSAPSAGLAEPVSPRLRALLGLEAAAETINGVPI